MHRHSIGAVSRLDQDRRGHRARRGEAERSESAGIVSFNMVYPREGCLEKALEVLREVVDRVRASHGLVRTRLYKSLDGRTLATHAEWKSKSQHDAMLRDEEFVRRFNQLRELGIYESHVYEITDDIYAILPEIDWT